MRLAVAALAILFGCGSSPQAGPTPQPTPRSPAPTPIAVTDCEKLSQHRHERCGTDAKAALEQCQIFVRLAEAAQCMDRAHRSFECGLSSVRLCGDAACCAEAIKGCDETDLAFDACLREFCGSLPDSSDCKYAFPPPERLPG